MSELRAESMITPTVRLKRPLARGGMGSVWVADHLSLDTEVVVKLMSVALAADPASIARFTREAAAAAQVKSPHVVQTFDHGITSEGVPYIVMELLQGVDLATLLERRGKLRPDEVSALCTQLAKALGKAHAAGVVHRDIKPENIFLCDADDGEIFVKVLDFGIAKTEVHLGSGTSTGTIMGTPYYMSPEQIVGSKSIDQRTDIWSLGVVAFEMLTGRCPFEGDTVGALTLAIHATSRPLPSTVDQSVPIAFDTWFARACAVDVDSRFATMRDASQALVIALGLTDPRAQVVLTQPLPPRRSANHVEEASTVLSATRTIDSLVLPMRRRPPLTALTALLACVVLLAVVGLLLRSTTRHDARRAPEANRRVATSEPSAARGLVATALPLEEASAPAAPSAPPTTVLALPEPRPAAARLPVALPRVDAPAASSGQRKAAPTPAVAPSAEPAVPAPAPPRGSDDDIK